MRRVFLEKIKQLTVVFLFIIIDALIIYLSFWIAVKLRELLAPWLGTAVIYSAIQRMLWICILFVITVFLTMGLYPGYGMTAVKELQLTSRAIILVYFLLMGVSYLYKGNYDFSRFVLLASFVMNLVILPLAHFATRNFFSRFPFYGKAVHIFGKAQDSAAIEKTLKSIRRMGWHVEAIYPLAHARKIKDIPSSPTIAILASDSMLEAKSYERNLSNIYTKVVVVPQKTRLVSLWVVPRDVGGALGLEFQYSLLIKSSIIVKKVIDFTVSLMAVILLSPLLLAVAVLVKLDSPGPIIFKQTRMGRYGRPFQLYKFRTMYADADIILTDLLASSASVRKEYKQFHKIRNDPRITRTGKILRRFSIDEFPQLFNVMAGDMSLSGPRPYLPAEKKEMGDYVKLILRVKPGITGWWQVLGRNDVDFTHRLEMDEFYISNWSVWMDIYIFLKTIAVIFVGRGY